MIDEEVNNLATIDTYIRKKQPFAVFRTPGEKYSCLLTQTNGEVRVVYDLKELNGQKGFVIAPFMINEMCPIVVIEPNQMQQVAVGDYKPELTVGEGISLLSDDELTLCTKEYVSCFDRFINALRDETYDKLVLSRSSVINRTENFSVAAVFSMACQQYIHSYVYLCYTPQTGVWLGSTPEVLLSGEQDEWNTVALAGTQPLQDGKLPQVWDEKNKKEQEYVTSYIRQQLHSLGISPVENGPYPAFAGALSHLKTDFYFLLKDNKGLGGILQSLHPTPAVCGLPKEEAYRFILKNEGYDRRYYSGFIGWLDPDGHTDLYVNLRCMHIGEKQLTLYAGGGILASSELHDEWQETEKKLQTMKRIISWH